MFFKTVKNRLIRRNILWVIISLLIITGTGFFVASNGFSSRTDWKYGLRFSDIGIPIPNWLLSCGSIFLGLCFLYLLISALRELFAHETYHKVLEAAQTIGNVSYVEQLLDSIEKSKLTKGGELRYNSTVFFYMKGTDVYLLPMKSITSIRPLKKTGKTNGYYIVVSYQDKNIEIMTKEKNMMALGNGILEQRKLAG